MMEEDEMKGSCNTLGRVRNAYKPDGPLERPWHSWDDNIKMDLKEI
jgi:hypothetical protein